MKPQCEGRERGFLKQHNGSLHAGALNNTTAPQKEYVTVLDLPGVFKRCEKMKNVN